MIVYWFVSKLRLQYQNDINLHFHFRHLSLTSNVCLLSDHRGYAQTAFGKVRRVKTEFGWGVQACPLFSCEPEAAVFVMRNMRPVLPQDKAEWIGYTFKLNDQDDFRPSHQARDNVLHAPMMANTHCIEKDETFNLSLYHDDDVVIFEASKPIRGGDMLIVDYGDEYNKELFIERIEARKRRAQELASRVHLSHSYKCPACGFTCAPRFRLRHFNKCKHKNKDDEGEQQTSSGDV